MTTRVKLMASAAADPVSLYLATEGVEANEFKRTSSRLIEMSSESYLALPARPEGFRGERVEHGAGGDVELPPSFRSDAKQSSFALRREIGLLRCARE